MRKPFTIALLFILSGTAICMLFLPEGRKNDLNVSLYTENKKMQVKWDENKRILLSDAQQLACSCDGKNWKIVSNSVLPEIYPADGKSSLSSVPTSFRWKAPIWNLPKASVQRCFVFDEAMKERSPFAYHTKLQQTSGLKVVSLFVDSDDFFSPHKGIYVVGDEMFRSSNKKFTTPWWDRPANYHKRGRQWERRAHVQFLDEKGRLEYESDAGIRIHGNATRAYPQKSLRLTARKEYGNGKFAYPFFGEESVSAYDDLILRNGGNDWDRTLIADEFIHSVFSHWPEWNVELIAQHYVPVEVYINGEYWGLHNLRERINEDYFSKRFSVSKKDVVVVEGDKVVYGTEEDQKEFDELISFCKTENLFQQENYEYVSRRLNVPAFMVYLVAEMYAANTDWPLNNVKCFRIRNKNVDSVWNKWNFVLWDMDYSMSYTGENAFETDMFKRLDKSQSVPAVLFRALFNHPDFYADFLKTIQLEDARFGRETMIAKMEEMAARIRPVMPMQIKRWRKPRSIQEWEKHLKANMDFIQNRQHKLKQHAKSYVSAKSIEEQKKQNR